MANISGGVPLIDPKPELKTDEQQSSSPSFPNTRWMKLTTDLSRNPGVFDDVFKKIKGTFHCLSDYNIS
jgi:hypothetical protein